jgi:thioredoxin reductase (NADPH)
MITNDEVRQIPLFAHLDDSTVAQITAQAADVRLNTGEWVAREGEPGAFFALLSGRFAIVKLVGGRQRQLAIREAGEYFGEIPILLGAPFFAGGETLVPCRLLRLSAQAFRAIVSQLPALHQELIEIVQQRLLGVEAVTLQADRIPLVIGAVDDLACHNVRDFLMRNFVDFEWRDPTNPADVPFIPALDPQAAYPVLIMPDGTTLSCPTPEEIARAVGLATTPAATEYDVVIIGGGPSGLAAAVYGASEGLHTLLIEEFAPGGQAGTSSRIENYLGFPIGVSGDDLADRALNQALRFGVELIVARRVTTLSPGSTWHIVMLDDGSKVQSHAVIIATGVAYRTLNVPGLERFIGAGVYYGAARSEALGMRGRRIFLIGGGNSAGQAAMFFANYAAEVTLLVRGPALASSMSAYLITQLATRRNITVSTETELVGVAGEHRLEVITVRHTGAETTETLPADGVFIFIGATVKTDWLPQGIACDAQGYLYSGADVPTASWPRGATNRDPFLLETSVPGIFATGDVRHGSVKRVAAGVGEGSMAIAFIHQALAQVASRPIADLGATVLAPSVNTKLRSQ